MFTLDFWCREVAAYKAAFADPALGDIVLTNCVKGITFVASMTVQQVPEHKDRVMEDFRVCYQIAKDRMGVEWLLDRAEIIATHGGPPEDSPA